MDDAYDLPIEAARRRLRFALFLLCSALLNSTVSGCASWSTEKKPERETSLLPPRQLNPDSVLVETVFVRFPQAAAPDLAEIWNSTNESLLDIELRRRLDQNGLRVGLIVGELPWVIRQQLESTGAKQTTDALEHVGLAADVDNKMRKLQCRAGRRKDLLVKPELVDPLTVITMRDDKHVIGETFERATVLFDLRAVPHGDGTATIELTPEIQHGDHRQTFRRNDFGVLPEMSRGLHVWNDLRIVAKLQPGQILLVASTAPAKALGSAFFVSKTAENLDEHVLLLLRLGETQLDELFAPEIVEQAHAMAERK